MTDDIKKIRILLIEDKPELVEIIKSRLKKYMRLPWELSHCVNIKEAIPRMGPADIIILELDLAGGDSPEKIFKDVEDMVYETPIIALTGKRAHNKGLVTCVMELGAADTMIRGQFGRLVDAIEFALIRQHIATDSRQSRDRASEDDKASDAAELKSAREDHEKKLEELEKTRKGVEERSKQTLRMFMGDYSVDRSDK